MDLGITGRTAIICAASKGLGRGCAFALAREGVSLVISARGAEALEATAAAIRAETGAAVTTVTGDVIPAARDFASCRAANGRRGLCREAKETGGFRPAPEGLKSHASGHSS